MQPYTEDPSKTSACVAALLAAGHVPAPGLHLSALLSCTLTQPAFAAPAQNQVSAAASAAQLSAGARSQYERGIQFTASQRKLLRNKHRALGSTLLAPRGERGGAAMCACAGLRWRGWLCTAA